MKINNVLLLFILFISLVSASEIETSITGSVVRQGNNIPLVGANVVISNQDGFNKTVVNHSVEALRDSFKKYEP